LDKFNEKFNMINHLHFPFVSIIIPCRNEERFIKNCLDSLLNQNYPKDKMEILVVDGMSNDKTREIIKEIKNKNSKPDIYLIDNHQKFTPFAFNIGFKKSKGDIIVRCDAHSEYDKNYIKKIVSWLVKDKKIGNVGGVWINKPSSDNLKARAIAFTLEHFFCVGPNKYRTGVKDVREVDTVPFGAWRRELFNKIGLWNENFLRAEDLEFNVRIKKAGYKIILDPEIKIYYYPRENFLKLFKTMFQYGYWKNYVNKELKVISSFRQIIPPLFVLYLLLAIIFSFISFWIWAPFIFYLVLSLLFSLDISFKHNDFKILPFSFWTFITSHIGYGLGYLKGVLDVWILKKQRPNKKQFEITR